MKKAALLLFMLTPLFLHAEQPASQQKRQIILAPVTMLTENPDIAYLRGAIYNVLLINLGNQKTLDILNEKTGAAAMEQTGDLEAYIQGLASSFPGATAIMAEFYAGDEKLHVLVNVWELDTFRLKNSFIRTMPADLDMLRNIEMMASDVAIAVARELPPTEREEVFNRQVISSLRRKINDEDRLVEAIFSRHNEISGVPFSGIGLGRSVIMWSESGPVVSPLASLEYSYFFDEPYHLRAGAEFLGFNLLETAARQRELSFELLAGMHTLSSFSISADAGLSISWQYNSRSSALSHTLGLGTWYPEVTRVTLGVPIHLGFTVYFSESLFAGLRLKYHGLSWTVEPLGPESYDIGGRTLKYAWGFSPWNFLCLSINVQAGLRF